MDLEYLKNTVIELNKEIYELSQLCYQLGNNNPENNVLIKERLLKLKKTKDELLNKYNYVA